MLSRPASAVLIVAASLALGACTASGGEDTSDKFSGEQRAVAKVIEELEKAAAHTPKADAEKVCADLITGELARRISDRDSDKNCTDALEDNLGSVTPGSTKLEVLKVTIDGDEATARVRNGDGDDELESDYRLVKGRSWRIAGF